MDVQGSYENLDDDGIVRVGSRIGPDDILVGKTAPSNAPPPGAVGAATSSVPLKRDHSLANRGTETSIVDRVMISVNSAGFKFVKIRTRSTRVPQIGDKFASRHGQKGTCGMAFRQVSRACDLLVSERNAQEDMPFTVQGIVPDIIIDPHCE